MNVILPSHHDEKALADKFCQFFVGKISTIRDNLAATNNSSSVRIRRSALRRSLLAARSSSEYHSVFGRSIMFFDYHKRQQHYHANNAIS
jgi:hypothetical protein